MKAALQSRPQRQPTGAIPPADLAWLVRYARHCRFPFPDGVAPESALRQALGRAAWRLLCRSPKERFLPILRNRELSIHSLITYCQRLVEHSFAVAPQALLLDFFVTQRRLYLDRPCRVPEDNDYKFMRIADRSPARLQLREVARVANWCDEVRLAWNPRLRWSTLVRRARGAEQTQRVHLAAYRQTPWHFYCHQTPWRGYEVVPLATVADLWAEGLELGTCLYRLSRECLGNTPSRFFGVRRQGKRVATLELSWRPPQRGDLGMDRQWGRWELRDLRLSYNRLPGVALVRDMQDFACMFNAWAKRPARHAPEEVEDIRRRLRYLDQRSDRRAVWPPSFAGAS